MAQAKEEPDKAPIQCQDNPYGFNAQVDYGDWGLYPLRRCTPFWTSQRRQPEEENLPRESPHSGIPVSNEGTENNLMEDSTVDGVIIDLSAQKISPDHLISLSG